MPPSDPGVATTRDPGGAPRGWDRRAASIRTATSVPLWQHGMGVAEWRKGAGDVLGGLQGSGSLPAVIPSTFSRSPGADTTESGGAAREAGQSVRAYLQCSDSEGGVPVLACRVACQPTAGASSPHGGSGKNLQMQEASSDKELPLPLNVALHNLFPGYRLRDYRAVDRVNTTPPLASSSEHRNARSAPSPWCGNPLRYMTFVLLVLLFIGLPVVLFGFGTGLGFLLLLGVVYFNISVMLSQTYRQCEELGLPGRAFAKLAFDSLACASFALNLVRKITLRRSLVGDPISFAQRVFDAATFARLIDRLV